MSLVANVLEQSGISTLLVGTVRDLLEQVKPPRAVYIDNPVGRTFGRPRANRKHAQLLADALQCVDKFKRKGQILDLAGTWTDRPGQSWPRMVEREILGL